MGSWIFHLFTFFFFGNILSSSSATNYAEMMQWTEELLRNRINLDKIQQEMDFNLEKTFKWFDHDNLKKIANGMSTELADADIARQTNYLTNVLGVEPTGRSTGITIGNSSQSEMVEMISAVIQNVTRSFMSLSMSCKVDLARTVVGISQGENWATDMLDAMGKIETGIKQGNRMLWGNYDECIEVKAIPVNTTELLFTGQYCTMDAIVNGMAGALGRPVALSLGVCIPSTCNPQEMKTFLSTVFSSISQKRLSPKDLRCQKQDLPLDSKAVAMTVICCLFLTIIVLATMYDAAKTLGKSSKNKDKPDKEKDDTKVRDSKHSENKINGITAVSKPNIISATDKDTGNGHVPESNGSVDNGHLANENTENALKDSPGKSLQFPKEKPTTKDLYVTSFPVSPWTTRSDDRCMEDYSTLEKILLSFSAYTNAKKLLNTKQGSGTLTSVNGIRFLTMSWVILGHSFLLGYLKNEVYILQKWTHRISFQAIENALVSVDTFFTLSGLLVSYLLLKDLSKNNGPKKTNWLLFYFHRFWRLTPVYMMIIGIYTCLSPYFTNGPSYPQGEDKNCMKYWWTNLLYINNFVYDEENGYGCIAWSWYLANDMQFYVLSPLLIVPFFWHVGLGVVSTIIFLGTTWGATAGLGIKNQWPPVLYGGGKHLENVGKMFPDYYIVPWCRMGPYIVGVVTGYILYRTKCKCRINRYLNLFLWAVFTTLACLILFGLHDALTGSPLAQPIAVLYLITHRTVWGACVCWVIFACSTGNGGIINSILSWKAFIPLSRLTYCAYLIHPIVLLLYVGSNRQAIMFTEITYIFLFLGILVSSLAISFVVSVALESPMMGIEKTLLGKKKK